MAQFDVHHNPGQQRDSIPYVVVVLSAVFDGYWRCIVIPLVRKSHIGTVPHTRFNPAFTIKGITVVLHPLEIVSVATDRLGEPVASLAEHGSRSIDAMGELVSRAYG